MKKVSALLVFIISSLMSFAQSDKQFSLGFNACPNIGWLSGQDTEPNDQIDIKSNGARMGFAYGLIFEYNFTENYTVATGVNHLFTGGKYSVLNVKPESELTLPNSETKPLYVGVEYNPIKLQYVQIPLTLRLKTNEIGYIKYFGELGFSGAFSLNSKTDNTVTSYNYKDNDGNPIVSMETNDYENIGFKDKFLATYFIVGAGGQYSLGGNTFIHVGLNMNLGLGNIISKKQVETYSDLSANTKLNNSYFALNIGILL